MKNLKLVFFFALLLILLLPFQSQAQEATGLFGKIGNWLTGGVTGLAVVFVSGILAKHGWTQLVKSIAKKGTVITKEVGELFADSSKFLAVLDQSIQDDGTIKQNSVSEIIAAGKEVIAEGKDVIISIRPKV